jgi:hypothetical protein
MNDIFFAGVITGMLLVALLTGIGKLIAKVIYGRG